LYGLRRKEQEIKNTNSSINSLHEKLPKLNKELILIKEIIAKEKE
jgi:hypothetical protein